MPGPIRPEEIRQIGRYPVRRFVAEGGMSWVFEVEDPELYNARRAIKLLKPEAAVGAELARFEGEVRTLAEIQHPNLIRVTAAMDLDEATGCHFYAMDFIEGGTLSNVRVGDADPDATVAAGSTHSVEAVCEFFVGILSGLARLHARGIIHRDIKPANIFLTPEGIPILADLGIAKQVGSAGVTQQGLVPGTPLYMSPEQALGEEVGAESDLFSLGLSLYRVLAGKSVYDEADGVDSTNSQAVLRHLWTLQGGGREFDLTFESHIPAAVQEVIRKSCRIQRGERYRSADEMGTALKGVLRELQRRDWGGAAEDPYTRPVGGGRALRFGIVAAVLGVVIAAGWLGYSQLMGSREREATLALRQSVVDAGSELQDLLRWLSESDAALASRIAGQTKPELDQASLDLEIGSVYLSEGNFELAVTRIQRARDRYTVACDLVLSEHLDGRAEARKRKALSLLDGLPEDTAELAPELWERVAAARQALEAPIEEGGCMRSATLRRQIDEAAAAEQLVAEVPASLGTGLLERARAALQEAEEQKLAAQGASFSHELYRSRMQSGERSLGIASKAFREARGGLDLEAARLARNHAAEARKAFVAAAAAGAALRAGRDAAEVASEAEAHFGIGDLRLELADAEAAIEGEAWGDARHGFEQVYEKIARLLESARGAIEAEKRAREVQTNAVDAGVGKVLLTDADRQISEARIKLQARKFSEAEELFKASWEQNASVLEKFLVDGKQTERVLAKVKEELELARSAERDATSQNPDSSRARRALTQGRDLAARAEQASNATEYREAIRLAREAQTAFREAGDVARADRARASATTLIARAERKGLAETEWLEAERRAERAFDDGRWDDAVAAYDALSERLGGQVERAEARDRRERERERTEKLAREQEERKQARVVAAKPRTPNRPPVLERTLPLAARLSVPSSEAVSFEVTASDPDGGVPQLSWFLDEAKVSEGSRYHFTPSGPGQHRVSVVARDQKGARSEALEWTVEVVAEKPTSVTEIVNRWCAAFAAEDMATLDEIMVWEGEAREKTANAFKKYDFRQTCEIENTTLRGLFATVIVLVHRETIDTWATRERSVRYKIVLTGSASAWKIEAMVKVL